MAGNAENDDGGKGQQDTDRGGGRGKRLSIAAAVILAILLVLLVAYAAGWIGGPRGPPKVRIEGFDAVVDGVADCTATFNYVLVNDGPDKGLVDIDYVDNGWVVAHDLYIVESGSRRYVAYSLEHVDCASEHNYEARIAAVS